MPKLMPDASTAYFRSVGGGRPFSDRDLTPEFVAEAERLRADVRRDEGGGGMCHVLSELMQMRHGWPMLSVAYLSADGDVICSSHIVSTLPCGSIIDWTRDQFGEGHSVSFIRHDSPEIGRYRPEFYEDFHPGHPDDGDGCLDAWADTYAGVPDHREQDRLRNGRGRGWWLDDLTALDEYDAEQERLARSPGAEAPARGRW